MTSTLPTLALRSALLAAALGSMGASCTIVASEHSGGDDAETRDEAPAFATDGCDPTAIATSDGGTCAECDANDGGDARICGESDVADCVTQENAYGERCQFCQTQDGEVLFDDCTVAPGEMGAARCETSAGDPSQGEDDSECSVCFDDAGNVVSSSCGPSYDECHEVDDGGRVCRECTRAGEVVSYQCDLVDLDPSYCEAYGNDVGECVDCYAESGALLTHQCRLFEDEPIVSCYETIDPSGLSCVQCFDQSGNLLESGCNTAVPEASACQLLEYTSQTCVVCVDAAGQPVLTDCTSTDAACEDPTAPDCAPPPECWFEYGADNALCRSCFVSSDAQEIETECLTNADLLCSGVPASELPPDPNRPDDGSGGDVPAPPSEPNAECLVCWDGASNVEVYRNCGNGGVAQPPVCVDEVDDAGSLCSVCFDAYTGEALYSSCEGGDTCYVTGERALVGANGESLSNENGDVIATCLRCADENSALAGSDFAALCSLPQACVGPDGFVDPDISCPALLSYTLAPRQCQNGWDVYQAAPGSEDELVAVLGWALSTHELSLAGVAVLGATVDTSNCADDCGCARGDLLEVTFEDVDLGAVREVFSSQLLQCGTDGDCPVGASCLEGVCGSLQ